MGDDGREVERVGVGFLYGGEWCYYSERGRW